MRRAAVTVVRRGAAGQAQGGEDGVSKLHHKLWALYFETTSAETATLPVRRGVVATTDAAVDTRDHPFVTRPLLAAIHRAGELTENDHPFVRLYEDLLAEKDPKKRSALQAKLDKIVPVTIDETPEQAFERARVHYSFLADLKKAGSKDKH